MTQKTKQRAFVTYLENDLSTNRAALANLRRGLGHPPGTVPETHKYVIRRLPAGLSEWEEQTHYLIASLFALHPKSTHHGNLGNHFAHTLDPNDPNNETANAATERRFSTLLTSHPDDLAFRLRQAISFLKAQGTDGIPINWHQLMRDVLSWGNPDWQPTVQKRWAMQFWRKQSTDNQP